MASGFAFDLAALALTEWTGVSMDRSGLSHLTALVYDCTVARQLGRRSFRISEDAAVVSSAQDLVADSARKEGLDWTFGLETDILTR